MEKNYSIIEELSIENIELKVNKIHDMCKQEIEDMTNRFTE